jgi:hypothetical protein
MSADSVLARGRTAALKLMVDACIVKHITSTSTNPTSGVITPTYSTLYTGACRVQQSKQGASGQPTDVGEAALVLLRLEVQLPMSVVGLSEGDEITITSSALDPDLVGRVFVVRDLAHKTHLTARRVGVVEKTS